MSTTAAPVVTATQVYRVYIKAAADAIWTAITDPEWTNRYGYGGHVHYDLKPGGALRVVPGEDMVKASADMGYELPEVIIDGEVVEADPPHLLKTTWRMLMDPGTAAEPASTLTYEIKEHDGGVCSLTVVHELPPTAPLTAALVAGAAEDGGGGGGHAWVLSDLKSLLETGRVMASE